jgi:hypothetical protein
MARAQVAGTGNIQGTIADQTGAVIANATVTLTEMSTQVKHTSQTDGSGVYVFPNITIGTYSLGVASPGFETYTQTGIVLEVGSSISINVNMTVGRADQKVEVKSEGLALQTEDASFKQTLDHDEIAEMPLNGRQLTGLIQLSGGSPLLRAMTLQGANTPTKRSRFRLPVAWATRPCGVWTAAITTTTWATAISRSPSRMR